MDAGIKVNVKQRGARSDYGKYIIEFIYKISCKILPQGTIMWTRKKTDQTIQHISCQPEYVRHRTIIPIWVWKIRHFVPRLNMCWEWIRVAAVLLQVHYDMFATFAVITHLYTKEVQKSWDLIPIYMAHCSIPLESDQSQGLAKIEMFIRI